MRVLQWARPRRWSILAEAALAVLVALVFWPVLAIGGGEAEQVEVVTDYLEALRDGDVERAETFVSVDGYLMPEADRSWLRPEALSADWEIESVALRSASTSTVHAVIASGEARVEGAFQMETTEDGPKIANPYLYLRNVGPMFAALEVNGFRDQVGTDGDTTLPVALYPGSYRLFASADGLGGGVPLLALPGSGKGWYGGDSTDLDAVMTGPVLDGEGIEARINEELAAWLDECAASGDLAPEGCPFSAAYDYGVAHDGREEFASVETAAWTVEAYPKVRFDRQLRLETVESGWIALSGSGTLLFGDRGEAALDGRCGVGVGNLQPVIGEDGAFTLELRSDQGNTCI